MLTGPPRTTLRRWFALVALVATAVSSQVALEGSLPRAATGVNVDWVRSPELMRRLVLGFDALMADVYWIRSVQHYGDTKLSMDAKKQYGRLYPLLDMTTSLDSRFNIAYRFGAILLSEGHPNGAGNTDQAIALLQKAMKEMPDKWQYPHDAAFVEYWWNRNHEGAAKWMLRAAEVPGAPSYLRTVAASMLAEGGAQQSARALWAEVEASAQHEWLRQAARRGLMQLDAEVAIDQLQSIVKRFHTQVGRFPTSWEELIRVRLLPGIPVDRTDVPFTLDPSSGAVDVSNQSVLYPLRRGQIR